MRPFRKRGVAFAIIVGIGIGTGLLGGAVLRGYGRGDAPVVSYASIVAFDSERSLVRSSTTIVTAVAVRQDEVVHDDGDVRRIDQVQTFSVAETLRGEMAIGDEIQVTSTLEATIPTGIGPTTSTYDPIRVVSGESYLLFLRSFAAEDGTVTFAFAGHPSAGTVDGDSVKFWHARPYRDNVPESQRMTETALSTIRELVAEEPAAGETFDTTFP